MKSRIDSHQLSSLIGIALLLPLLPLSLFQYSSITMSPIVNGQPEQLIERRTSDGSTQDGQAQNDEHDEKKITAKVSAEQVGVIVETQFEGLFHLDRQNFSPNYLIGDFNGDGVEDIIASVKLAYELDPNDKSEPPFWFKNPGPQCSPRAKCIDDSEYKQTLGYLARFRIGRMLAVIHGDPELGWINTRPNQRFLITNVFGKHTDRMKLFRGKLLHASVGDDPVLPPPPSSNRDLVLLLDDRNRGTAVHWNDGNYHWYPVDELPK